MNLKAPPHDSISTHLTGQSEFIDDRPLQRGELLIGLVLSSQAHAKIKSINIQDMRRIDGVLDIITGSSFHHNVWGTIFQDQPIIADGIARYHGEIVAAIATTNPDALRAAKHAAVVNYEPLEPILSIDQAIEKKSFIAPPRFIKRGTFPTSLASGEHKISGQLKIAGQEHFYLESQASIAYPTDNGGVHVHSSSQHPTEVQHVVAHALGLKYSDVVCTVKRMGGAFGGKESQASPFAAIAAFFAHKLKRPARLVLNRDDDMMITGKRNPFQIDYEVIFKSNGKISALKANLFSDAGAYADLSTSIMERAMLHSDNAYFLPTAEITGTVCRTNSAPTTAFRGFGGPKGVVMIEGIMEKIAEHLGLDALDVRELNCYKNGQNTTHYGQEIKDETLKELFKDARTRFLYDQSRKEVREFNARSRTHLKGLSLTAVKFGISFTTRFLNQGSALVNLHLDGTVQVSTGATEMGQGVNIKIAQIVAGVFSIPLENIQVMSTSTEKNHNTSPTAASSGSDINGAAAQTAALQIRNRLALVAIEYFKRPEKLRGKMASVLGVNEEIKIDESISPEGVVFENSEVFLRQDPATKVPLNKIIEEAYYHRVSLGAYGFFRYPGIHFNKETGKGNPFFYYTNGVACSQVSVNRDTGELRVDSTQILMDLGRPLNHGVDQGQIYGGFVQGLGWLTTEKLHYDEKGALLTHAPSTYKIPSIQDIPKEFTVEFFDNDRNWQNVLGSKAVGEPPLLLSASVWCAIQNALSYAGKSDALVGVPATYENIFLDLVKRNESLSSFEVSDLKGRPL